MALMSLVSHVPTGCSNQVSRVRRAVKELDASEASGGGPLPFKKRDSDGLKAGWARLTNN